MHYTAQEYPHFHLLKNFYTAFPINNAYYTQNPRRVASVKHARIRAFTEMYVDPMN